MVQAKKPHSMTILSEMQQLTLAWENLICCMLQCANFKCILYGILILGEGTDIVNNAKCSEIGYAVDMC